MNYNQKIETKLNDLQKEFFRLFRKSFPSFVDKIEIEKGEKFPDNFCFSIKSNSEIFGKLFFYIDEDEITVLSNFAHKHFETYIYDKEKDNEKRILLTCEMAIEYINEIVNGNIIIEYQQKDNKILKAFEYHKDNLNSPFSSTINFKEEPTKKSFISKIKSVFNRINKKSIDTKKVNWFGNI